MTINFVDWSEGLEISFFVCVSVCLHVCMYVFMGCNSKGDRQLWNR